jgi:signal transduction histidine kinase
VDTGHPAATVARDGALVILSRMPGSQDRSSPDQARRAGLAEALQSVRGELIAGWAARVKRELTAAPVPTVELMDHMPAFVDELIERAARPWQPQPSQPAEQHGVQRLRLGFNVGEVVREYGLLHESIIEATNRIRYRLEPSDQVLIASFLNQGVADAVSQYVGQRDSEVERQTSEHMGFIAHEVRNGLSAALLGYQAVRRSHAEASPHLERLGRSLRNVAVLVDNALTQSWLRMGVVPKTQAVPLRLFLEELVQDLAADTRDRTLQMDITVAGDLVIAADPRLLRSAVTNLVTNALKFSPPGSTVTVRASAPEDRLFLEVEDRCGGLPSGKAEELFSPLVQKHEDRSGFGLGLAIVLQAAEAHGGTVKVRDVPGVGCVFSLDLPIVREVGGDGSRRG